jgi:FHS family glucose/mannose:H+ symporter-like MFS transporter
MPYLAFASNFLWVLVLGLLGPSVPAIRDELGIGYTRAGLFFTMLSLGSLFGTFLGGLAADRLPRKLLFAGIALLMAVGLAGAMLAPSYGWFLAVVFLFSLCGSPAGVVGQSIMLDMFPERRAQLLSVQTMFSAIGSLAAPLLVSANLAQTAPGRWRWPFAQAAGLAMLLFLGILLARLPAARGSGRTRGALRRVLASPRVLGSAVLIFFSVAPDLGFSFWLAEHFRTDLGVGLRLSSAVVSLYLVGMIGGRLATSRLVKGRPGREAGAKPDGEALRIRLEVGAKPDGRPAPRLLQGGLALSIASLAAFLAAPWIAVKLAAIVAYGLGSAPVFPLLVANGTEQFPDSPGVASGVLFAALSLGGMAFPILLGAAASAVGIRGAYLVVGAVLVGLLASVSLAKRRLFSPAAA